MSRFITTPQRVKEVNIFPQRNVDFYANILAGSQQNLDKATGLQMDYIEKLNQIPIYTQEDRDATIGKVQERLKGELDKENVSASRIANTIMEINREITPGIQALKAKAQAIELYDKMRIQYGANALMGDDPRTLSIKDDKGNFRSLNEFQALGMDMSDIDKLFLQSQTNVLNKPGGISYIRGTGNNGIPVGVMQTVETKGLSEEEKFNLYHPSTENARKLAETQLEAMPQILVIKGGDKEAALQAIMNRNWSTSGSFKRDVNYGFMQDPSYRVETKPATYKGRLSSIVDLEDYNTKIKESEEYANMANALRGKKAWYEGFKGFENIVRDINWWAGTDLVESSSDKIENTKQILPQLIYKNKELYKTVSKKISSDPLLQKKYGFDKEGSIENKKKAIDIMFLDALSQQSKAEASKQIDVINYSPSEIENLTPDLKAYILPKLQGLDSEGKPEDVFNGSSYSLIPSKGILRINTTLPSSPYIDVNLKDIDQTLGVLSDFIKSVNELDKDKINGDNNGFVYRNSPVEFNLEDFTKSEKGTVVGIMGVKKEDDKLYEYLLSLEGIPQTLEGKVLKRRISSSEYTEELVNNFEGIFNKGKQ